jgi:hypothetical protein
MTQDCLEVFRQGPYLSAEAFSNLFDKHWEMMSQRFFKYEALQSYDEGPESACRAYMAGDVSLMVDRLKAAYGEEEPFFSSARRRGVSLLRVHAAELPLSLYMQAEYYSYILSERLGERILYLNRQGDGPQNRIPDFVMFDTLQVLAHDYDETGLLRGAWSITDPANLKAIEHLADTVTSLGVPFRELWSGDSKIIAAIG